MKQHVFSNVPAMTLPSTKVGNNIVIIIIRPFMRRCFISHGSSVTLIGIMVAVSSVIIWCILIQCLTIGLITLIATTIWHSICRTSPVILHWMNNFCICWYMNQIVISDIPTITLICRLMCFSTVHLVIISNCWCTTMSMLCGTTCVFNVIWHIGNQISGYIITG